MRECSAATTSAGKTGTTNIGGTNESKDVWFNGFTPNLVATVWVGYDQENLSAAAEQGSNTALPIWIHYMREALKGVPEYSRPMPEGLVTLRISPDTGMLASGENPDAILETFMTDHLPGSNAHRRRERPAPRSANRGRVETLNTTRAPLRFF